MGHISNGRRDKIEDHRRNAGPAFACTGGMTDQANKKTAQKGGEGQQQLVFHHAMGITFAWQRVRQLALRSW
jgi:hypothetical protein